MIREPIEPKVSEFILPAIILSPALLIIGLVFGVVAVIAIICVSGQFVWEMLTGKK